MLCFSPLRCLSLLSATAVIFSPKCMWTGGLGSRKYYRWVNLFTFKLFLTVFCGFDRNANGQNAMRVNKQNYYIVYGKWLKLQKKVEYNKVNFICVSSQVTAPSAETMSLNSEWWNLYWHLSIPAYLYPSWETSRGWWSTYVETKTPHHRCQPYWKFYLLFLFSFTTPTQT